MILDKAIYTHEFYYLPIEYLVNTFINVYVYNS